MDYTHGSHWECVVENAELFFAQNLKSIVQESSVLDHYNEYGFNLASEKKQDNDIHVLLHQESEHKTLINITTILIDKTLWTAYPCLNTGYTKEVVLDEIHEVGNIVEGLISCHLSDYPDFSITYFDPMYFKNKEKYKVGMTCEVVFAGFAYKAESSTYDDTTIDIGEGETAPIKGMSMFLPSESGQIDDYKIFSPVLDIEDFEAYGQKMKSIKIRVLNTIDNNFEFPIFISESNMRDGYVPEIGEDINTSVWITGMLSEG